jgi:flagellar biosynthesis/type III secretory pathway protein FliH
MDRLKEISSDEQARQLARMREVGERDYRSGMKSARKEGLEEGLEKGRAEGRAEGKAEGRAEGKAEGRAEGRAEGKAEGRAEGKAEGRAEGEAQAKRLFLKSLLKVPATGSLSDETLAQLVGLPIEQVAEMRRTLAK